MVVQTVSTRSVDKLSRTVLNCLNLKVYSADLLIGLFPLYFSLQSQCKRSLIGVLAHALDGKILSFFFCSFCVMFGPL